MKKDLFYIGRFGVHGYGLMIGIGFILALFLGEYRRICSIWRNYFGCSLLHALLQSEEVKIPGLF